MTTLNLSPIFANFSFLFACAFLALLSGLTKLLSSDDGLDYCFRPDLAIIASAHIGIFCLQNPSLTRPLILSGSLPAQIAFSAWY